MATQIKQTEVVVIGAGPAGYVCAIRLAQLGKRVTVIDRAELGGVCLNRGCIPSKALIHAGSVFEKIKNAGAIGIETAQPKLNLVKMMEWKAGVVNKLTSGVKSLLGANGCQVITGSARFVASKMLEVKQSDGTLVQLEFQNAVIATGSEPTKLPGWELNANVLDSTGALSQTELPTSLLCIGGGYIGLELGTFYSKIGTQVTVVEAGPELLGMVDSDLTQVVQKHLAKRGVKVLLNSKVVQKKVTSSGVVVAITENGATREETFSKVLVTVGRKPLSANLGLESIGLSLDSKGFVPVDALRRTKLSHIYAIGDVAGEPLLAHKGSKEGIVVAEVIAGHKTQYDVVAMPAVIFTDPEIATVGLSERQAKSQGTPVQTAVFPFVANGRALSVQESDGFVKIIGDPKTGRLLGVHIVGPEASNLIAEATLAIEMGAQVEDLALTVHAHPTLPEAIMEASEAFMGHAIHLFQKKTTRQNETVSTK